MPTPEEIAAAKAEEEAAAARKAAEEAAAALAAGETVPASRLTGLIREGQKKDDTIAALTSRLEAIEADKLSDIEKAKLAAEKAGEETVTQKTVNAELRRQLNLAATAAYLKTAHNPEECAAAIPADLVVLDDGRLTAESKKGIDGWAKAREYLFDTGTKPGDAPGPGNLPAGDVQAAYEKACVGGTDAEIEAAFAALQKTP